MASLRRAFDVLFVERRLPHAWDKRIQHALYKKALTRSLRQAFALPPMPCAPDARVELHMVTSIADYEMAVMALKSLLRYAPGLAVVVHGDETLDDRLMTAIAAQIPGTRFVPLTEAVRLAAAAAHPIADYRARYPARMALDEHWQRHARAWALRIFDVHLSARAERIIVLDSDSLFLQPPGRVLEWIAGDDATSLFPSPWSRNLHVPADALQQLFPGLPIIPAFNAGLLCFTTRALPLELMLSVSRKLFAHPNVPVFADECVWRYAYSQIPHEMLPHERYPMMLSLAGYRSLTAGGDHIEWAHFLMKHRQGLYRRLADQVVRELGGQA